jgi:hypothetical protein
MYSTQCVIFTVQIALHCVQIYMYVKIDNAKTMDAKSLNLAKFTTCTDSANFYISSDKDQAQERTWWKGTIFSI